MHDDLRAFGIKASAAARAAAEHPMFEVDYANWDAVQVFCGSCTQWRTGMAGATGLDYPAVECVMRMHQVSDTAETLARVQVIEVGVLEVWRKARERERNSSGNHKKTR
ncbi:DUF1799 domain-containing protein [Flagellatimonas centrodinii]|uniref:DUF1799 domain-containing protein n=1 Tax=Flagellatimonas centrodinii TaxID=2806210 RepID=UPI001FEEF68B|nr:DUF1799 domain-containing protein [Flagellatimonas centrodinii]ULQ45972.1 DUF1799 domain-containing protein [Flagellatimonas centrodinii]